jgi:hypothetical protein
MLRPTQALAPFLAAALAALGACRSADPKIEAVAAAAATAQNQTITPQPATSLLSAIAAAQASEPGTHFLSADFDGNAERDCFHVFLLGEHVLHDVVVDAADGKLLGAEEGKLAEEDYQQILDVLGDEPVVGIERAITSALAGLPGAWARDACRAQEAGSSSYVVLLVCSDGEKVAILSAADGRLLELREPGEDPGSDG